MAEFDYLGGGGDPLGCGKVGAARLLDKAREFGNREHHVFVVFCGVFDLVLGDVISCESEAFDAVSLVIYNVESVGFSGVNRVRVLVYRGVKSGFGLRCDNGR